MSQKDGANSQRRRVLQGLGVMLGTGTLASTVSADERDDEKRNKNGDAMNQENKHEDAEFCFPDNGLVTIEGGESVEATVACIERAIEDADPMLIATVDHAENAASVGEDLRPTILLLFGNPAAGTPLMQETQSVGIDLPQKMLVWEDEDGEVNVTYNDPEYVATRHGIEGQEELLGMIGDALATLAESGQNETE